MPDRPLPLVSPGLIVRVMVAVVVTYGAASLSAQIGNPLVSRWANARVQLEEIRFLQQSQQITPDQARARTAAVNDEIRLIQTAVRALPRAAQTEIGQETERLFQTRIIPLREQWNQALLQKRQSDQARTAELQKQLQADAEAAGRLQAARALLRERAQQGGISQSEVARQDREAEQQVLGIHRKYDALDDERARLGQGPYWAATFARAEAAYTTRAVNEGRLRLRLDDTQTDIGKDAHRAADLTLTIQRNQYFVSQRAMTAPAAQAANATAQSLLTTLQQKYAASASAADYRDRVARLIQEKGAAQRPQWEREAAAARQAAAEQAQPSPAVPPPGAQPVPVPQQTAVPDTAPPVPAATPNPSQGRSATTSRPRTTTPRRTPQQTVPTTEATMPRYLPRPESQEGGGLPWMPIAVVLLAGGTAAGVYVLRVRKTSGPPTFQEAPVIASPPASRAVAPAPRTTAASAVASAPLAGHASLKAIVFAQQREKYQTRYNDALDQVTQASAALSQLAPLLAAVHRNLQVLAQSMPGRVEALIVARYGGTTKALLNAALLRPVWRLFKRGGLLLRVGIGVGIYWVGTTLLAMAVNGAVIRAIVYYAIYVAIAFFIERHLVLKAPISVLKKNTSELKSLRLSYTYAGQRPQVIDGNSALYGVRVVAADKTPLAHEEVFDASLGTGTYSLAAGTLAGYRMDLAGGAAVLGTAANNEFIAQHGSLLHEVIGDLGSFAGTTLPPLAQYGQALWQKQRAAHQLPQLEALVRDVDRIEKLWEDTYVSDEVFEFLMRSVDMFNMRDAATPPGLLLYGDSGNGKKHLARKVSETLSARFEQVNPSKLTTAEQIETLWTSSRGTDPVVLFIPNVDTVFPRTPDGASAHNTLEFVAEWEKHQPSDSRVWVIMTARSDESIDEAILNHVGRDSKIEVKPPDADGRLQLFQIGCQQYQVGNLPSEPVLRTAGGSSIREIGRIVMAAKRAALPRQPDDEHWKQAIVTVRGAAAKFQDKSKTWDNLVLPGNIKEQLQVACKILQNADDYRRKGIDIPRILLYGPPGTGKTEIARTIANESGVQFVDGSLKDIKAGYVGQSVGKVSELFAKARRQAPAVLFLDEIDAATRKRGSEGADQFTEEIVNVMLTELEGAAKVDRPVLVLAATNRPDTMDPAILDRFKRKIEIPAPDLDGRRTILKNLLNARREWLAADFDVDEVATAAAQRSAGHAGRGLRGLIENAMNQAVAIAESSSPPASVCLTRAMVMSEVDHLADTGFDKVDASARWDTLVVAPDTLAQLRQLSDALRHIETFQRQGIEAPRGAVLWGPPGTGKTQIAKTLANESDVRFLFRTGGDLGHTAKQVRAVFDDARAVAPCILFFDEFEKAAQSREKGGSAEVVTELLAQMQGAKKTDRPVFVLAATNYLDQMDDAILSRFTYRIEVPNPEVEQRERLFQIALARIPRGEFDVPALAAELARSGGGLSGRDINDVVVRASQAAAQRALAAGTPDRVVVTREDFVREVERMIVARRDAVDPTARWDTLILSDGTIKTLKQISSAVRNIEDRLKQGIDPPRGAVLFGPPGTGKTQIARTLANESGVQFVSASAKDITGQFVGESTQKVGRLFAEARKKAPCILFIDEFENAAASRTGTKGSGFAEEVVTQLLTEMDGVKENKRAVFVLAATNHLERVDPAVISRFDYQVEVPNPTPEQRERLFENALRRYPRVDFDVPAMAATLAQRAGGLAGRQIGDLVKKAVQDAAQRAEDAGTPNDIVLTSADLLAQLAPKGRPVSDDDLTKVWSQIVLKPGVKETLLSMIRLFNSGSKAAPRGLLLYGPPGTGKTEIARLLARSTGCEFLSADLTRLKGSYIGESGKNVRELWDKARTHGRAIIFVDECDGVFARRGGTSTDAAVEEIANAFLPMWDGLESAGQIWVVGATNKPDRIDEALHSRFGEQIEIGLPEAAERIEILRLELQKLESSIEVPAFVGKATSGFAGRHLSRVAAAMVRQASARGGQADEAMWQQVIRQLATPSTETVDPGARWNTLILPEPVLKRLRRTSDMLKHAETLREQGLEAPKAMLLYGPPGTGKTQVARTIANESGLNFIAASPSDVKGAHLGVSGRLVKELFERARARPTVVFIDEIESVAAARGGPKADQYTGEIVNELLTQMDGVRQTTGTVFLLAATNYPDLVDAAVLSRFEHRVEIPNPGPDERRRMISTFIGKRRVDFDVDGVAGEVAMLTDNFSGRDLTSLVRRASQQAVERAIDAGTPHEIVLTRDDLLAQVGASGA